MINKFSISQFYDSKTINLHSGINFIPTSVHLYGQDYSMRDVILSVLRPFIDSGTGTGIPQKHKYLTTIYPSLKIESNVTINNNEFIYHDKGKTRKDIQRYFEQLWKSRKTIADFPLILYYYKPKIVHKSNFYADINISTADTFNCRSSFAAYSGSLRDPFTVNTDFDLSYIFHKYMVALQAQHDSENEYREQHIQDTIDYSKLYYWIQDIFPQFSFVFTENPNVARVNFDKYITDDDKANGGKVNLALKYEWQFTLLDFLVRAYRLTLGDLNCTNGTVMFELPNLSEDDNDAFITALNILSEYFLNVQFVVITDKEDFSTTSNKFYLTATYEDSNNIESAMIDRNHSYDLKISFDSMCILVPDSSIDIHKLTLHYYNYKPFIGLPDLYEMLHKYTSEDTFQLKSTLTSMVNEYVEKYGNHIYCSTELLPLTTVDKCKVCQFICKVASLKNGAAIIITSDPIVLRALEVYADVYHIMENTKVYSLYNMNDRLDITDDYMQYENGMTTLYDKISTQPLQYLDSLLK